MRYKLTEVKPGIFLAEFHNQYDLAMTFLRYQEYYESASSRFKGNQFTIIDYMEWYAKKHKGIFTYTDDWYGFNIPVSIIYEVQQNSTAKGPIIDRNKYDDTMDDIRKRILIKRGYKAKSYLIGTVKGKKSVIKHEIAHALYCIYPEYKKEMDKLYSQLSPEYKKYLREEFKKLGYAKSVWKDEAQAYLSTGDYLTPADRKPFADLLNKFIKTLEKEAKPSSIKNV